MGRLRGWWGGRGRSRGGGGGVRIGRGKSTGGGGGVGGCPGYVELGDDGHGVRGGECGIKVNEEVRD